MPEVVLKKIEEPKEVISDSYEISEVPFAPQAPFANWDALHDEACEEASIIIAYYYLKGRTLTAELMEEEIQGLYDWQVENWGTHKDLTASETVELAQKYYGLHNLKVQNISTIDEIKKEIAQNHLVITPSAGRLLGNPYFRSPGPIYHMLVVKGFSPTQVITNDVGTKRGESYKYSNSIFLNAIHDWTGDPDTISEGPKNIIVVQN